MQVIAELLVALISLVAALLLVAMVVGAVLTWRRIERDIVARILRRALAEAPTLAALRTELADLADATHAQLAVLAAVDRELRERHAMTTGPLRLQPDPVAAPHAAPPGVRRPAPGPAGPTPPRSSS